MACKVESYVVVQFHSAASSYDVSCFVESKIDNTRNKACRKFCQKIWYRAYAGPVRGLTESHRLTSELIKLALLHLT